MKLIIFTSVAVLLFASYASAQTTAGKNKKKLEGLQVSFNNSHTAMPYGRFASLLYKEFHPGIEVGTGFNWKEKKKHDWFQTLKVGYSYHQFVQHSIMLYTEFGYRYKFPAGISAHTKLGAGYLHAIEDSEVFLLGENGEYKRSEKFGRSHPMASLSIGAAKNIGSNGWQLFMDYQQRFQVSFIDAYVPALPVNSLHIGTTIPFRKK